jgi:hypothetical protein
MRMALQERDFYNETSSTKPATYTCPLCRRRNEFHVRWVTRIKKDRLKSYEQGAIVGENQSRTEVHSARCRWLLTKDDRHVRQHSTRAVKYKAPAGNASAVRITATRLCECEVDPIVGRELRIKR